MVQCIECGTALKDMLEDEAPEYDAPKPEEPLLPPGEYKPIVTDLASATASRLVRKLAAGGIPVRVEAHGYTMRLLARSEDAPAALAILAREGVVPEPVEGSDKAVAAEGGPCPACGADVAVGSQQCPGCGLQLSAAEQPCEKCGEPLAPDEQACPACGYRQG